MQRSPKGCKKAEDTNDQSETLSSMIHRDRSTGGSLYFGTWYFDPTKLIKIRFHLTDRRRDGMEGWIAWKRAAGGSPPPCWNWIWRCVMLVEFPWAGINWKRIDLTLNADISTRLHICKLKFARLIVHGPFSLPSPTPPLVPIRNLSRKPSFPTIEFTFSSYGCDRSIRQGEMFRPMVMWIVSMVSNCIYALWRNIVLIRGSRVKRAEGEDCIRRNIVIILRDNPFVRSILRVMMIDRFNREKFSSKCSTDGNLNRFWFQLCLRVIKRKKRSWVEKKLEEIAFER